MNIHFIIVGIALYNAIITTMGLYFGIRNWRRWKGTEKPKTIYKNGLRWNLLPKEVYGKEVYVPCNTLFHYWSLRGIGMTEKRFYIQDEKTIKDNLKYVTENGYVLSFKTDAEELCDLLNALAEENEQLKQYKDAIMNWDSSKVIRVNRNTGEVDLVDKEVIE